MPRHCLVPFAVAISVAIVLVNASCNNQDTTIPLSQRLLTEFESGLKKHPFIKLKSKIEKKLDKYCATGELKREEAAQICQQLLDTEAAKGRYELALAYRAADSFWQSGNWGKAIDCLDAAVKVIQAEKLEILSCRSESLSTPESRGAAAEEIWTRMTYFTEMKTPEEPRTPAEVRAFYDEARDLNLSRALGPYEPTSKFAATLEVLIWHDRKRRHVTIEGIFGLFCLYERQNRLDKAIALLRQAADDMDNESFEVWGERQLDNEACSRSARELRFYAEAVEAQKKAGYRADGYPMEWLMEYASEHNYRGATGD